MAKDRTEILESLHTYGVNPSSRELYLFGEPRTDDISYVVGEPGVEYQMANRLIRNLGLLQGTEPILVHMKTCGGNYEEGMAIYDALRFCKSHVTIVSYTHARSMSSIILQAADRRVLMPSSYVMLHWGTFGIEGEYQTVKSNIHWAERCEVQYLGVLIDAMRRGGKYSRWSKARIEAMLREEFGRNGDVFLTPEEAIHWGLADEIFSGWDGLGH